MIKYQCSPTQERHQCPTHQNNDSNLLLNRIQINVPPNKTKHHVPQSEKMHLCTIWWHTVIKKDTRETKALDPLQQEGKCYVPPDKIKHQCPTRQKHPMSKKIKKSVLRLMKQSINKIKYQCPICWSSHKKNPPNTQWDKPLSLILSRWVWLWDEASFIVTLDDIKHHPLTQDNVSMPCLTRYTMCPIWADNTSVNVTPTK